MRPTPPTAVSQPHTANRTPPTALRQPAPPTRSAKPETANSKSANSSAPNHSSCGSFLKSRRLLLGSPLLEESYVSECSTSEADSDNRTPPSLLRQLTPPSPRLPIQRAPTQVRQVIPGVEVSRKAATSFSEVLQRKRVTSPNFRPVRPIPPTHTANSTSPARSAKPTPPSPHRQAHTAKPTPPSYSAKSPRQVTPPSHSAKSLRQVAPPSCSAKLLRQPAPSTGSASTGRGAAPPFPKPWRGMVSLSGPRPALGGAPLPTRRSRGTSVTDLAPLSSSLPTILAIQSRISRWHPGKTNLRSPPPTPRSLPTRAATPSSRRYQRAPHLPMASLARSSVTPIHRPPPPAPSSGPRGPRVHLPRPLRPQPSNLR